MCQHETGSLCTGESGSNDPRLPYERQEVILSFLLERRWATLGELSALIHVSRNTVRRDLDAIARGGRVARVRGGAALVTSLTELYGPGSPWRGRERSQRLAPLPPIRWAPDADDARPVDYR
jgi:hypothetical protein